VSEWEMVRGMLSLVLFILNPTVSRFHSLYGGWGG